MSDVPSQIVSHRQFFRYSHVHAVIKILHFNQCVVYADAIYIRFEKRLHLVSSCYPTLVKRAENQECALDVSLGLAPKLSEAVDTIIK